MEKCRNCGKPVAVMCQRGTGFCGQICGDDYVPDAWEGWLD